MNLLEETLSIMEGHNKSIADIECANVYTDENVLLHSEVTSLASLDIKYDAGYGGQEVHGWITFNDNTWLERCEYDGSEWWDYRKCPGFENLI